MNAMLVFDPSNDLLFVKSDTNFRSKVLKYSKSSGLLNSTATTSQFHHSRPISPAKRAASWYNQKNLNESKFNDSSAEYLDLLRLLLTPYVASLRLSSQLASQTEQADLVLTGAPPKESPQIQTEPDLLAKFVTSINLNHECPSSSSSSSSGAISSSSSDSADEFDENQLPKTFSNQTNQDSQEFSPRRFSATKMPVDCLANCQIVYCQVYEFIFVHLQELARVSGFKMRLLQKRVDLFARLSLLLFGPALNSMRVSSSGESACENVQILGTLYDVWTDHQFEPEFMLEACERLLVGGQIEHLCRETLRKVSLHMRKSTRELGGELQQHALLFADTKLISTYSCKNSQPLSKDDLILLMLMVKAHNLPQRPRLELKPAGWSSEFVANRHTCEIAGSSSSYSSASKITNLTTMNNNCDDSASRMSSSPQSSSSPTMSQSNWQTRQRSRRRPTEKAPKQCKQTLPNQILTFLSTDNSSLQIRERVRVPHMIRFVSLNGPPQLSETGVDQQANDDELQPHEDSPVVTMLLISEVSTAYLAVQLHRLLKISLELNKPSISSWPKTATTSTSTINSAVAAAAIGSSGASSTRLKLNQIARVNDCVCAIRAYFHGPPADHFLPATCLRASSGAEQQLNCTPESNAIRATGNSAAAVNDVDHQQSSSSSSGQSKLKTFFANLYGSKSNRNSSSHSPESTSPDSATKRLYDLLDPTQRRVCRHLLARLDDLGSSNVQAYMRQSFGLSADQHKRDALLSATCTILRDSIYLFVIKAQSDMWNQTNNQTNKSMLANLNDLFEHIKLMAQDSLADLMQYLMVKCARNLTLGAPLTHDMLAVNGFIYVDRSRQEMLISPLDRATCSSSYSSSSVAAAKLEGDLLGFQLSEGTGSESSSSLDESESEESSTSGNQHQPKAIPEQLMKNFTCFIYSDRLARGKTSFTSNDGTYVYSYLIWFQRQSDSQIIKPDQQLKKQTAKYLKHNFHTLPNVTSDNFFHCYTNKLFTAPSYHDTGWMKEPETDKQKSQVQVECRISSYDSKNRRLTRKKLTQIHENDEICKDNLQHFVLTQASSSTSAARARRLEIRATSSGGDSEVPSDTASSTTTTTSTSMGGRQRGGAPSAVRCYELFCIHRASLLVHRSQVLADAQLLAKRLAELLPATVNQ